MFAQGLNGFLGTRASLMVDVVVVAMAVVLAVMAWSICQVRYQRRYTLHKRVQVSLGLLLAVAVTLFELDIQYASPWRERAAASPYFSPVWTEGWVNRVLIVHLVFAVSSAVLWIAVIARALRRFPNPPAPCPYSRRHMFWARLAAVDMTLTTLTGWTFYYLAFVARAAPVG